MPIRGQNMLNPRDNQTSSQNISQVSSTPMTQDEELVYNGFEKFQNLYCSAYNDENKQKDFVNKLSPLFSKLKGHELKQNIINNLKEFVICKIFIINFSV